MFTKLIFPNTFDFKLTFKKLFHIDYNTCIISNIVRHNLIPICHHSTGSNDVPEMKQEYGSPQPQMMSNEGYEPLPFNSATPQRPTDTPNSMVGSYDQPIQ